MIFYEKPVALNRERHRHLKLSSRLGRSGQSGQFGFARATNSVLMAASELNEASRDYPVVFVGNAGGPYMLAGLVGLHDNENLFVNADGHWKADAYIPAFVRRYPFVLADDGQGQLTVCIDESFPGLNEDEGEALFDDEGKDSSLLQGALEFLKLFHAEMQRTGAFCARLAELDLLVAKTIRVERNGKQEVLNGLYIVDEQKLRDLTDAQVLELYRNGYLSWVYAHLHSLGNADRLARMQVASVDAGLTIKKSSKKAG
ncbi:MAG: SapC family protein [Gallionellaceae bacterium]|jgi:hypothetical protein|nr:SapC family protein [Gallionellaceae bacterium]